MKSILLKEHKLHKQLPSISVHISSYPCRIYIQLSERAINILKCPNTCNVLCFGLSLELSVTMHSGSFLPIHAGFFTGNLSFFRCTYTGMTTVALANLAFCPNRCPMDHFVSTNSYHNHNIFLIQFSLL